MFSQEDNDLLCRVGPGTAMNTLGKRYWLPVCKSEAVKAGGAPERIELLGEKYIVWRAEDDRLGFFDEACPHRRASLALARNGDCALTCIYHGWTFGVDGNVLDVPSEPLENRENLRSRVKLNHYAVKEVNGTIWVYLGDQDNVPAFPEFEFNTLKPAQVLANRGVTNCSWLQTFEAAIDSAHLNFLHAGHVAKMSNDDTQGDWKLMTEAAPKFAMEKTKYGFKEVAIRSFRDGSSYFRLRHAALPFFSLVAFQPGAPMLVVACIPINDECNAQWLFTYTPQDSIMALLSAGAPPDEDTAMPDNTNNFAEGVGSVENLWNQDRELMKTHWSGIPGPLPWEDIAVVESMGPIVDRSLETLGSTDVIIIQNRRILISMLKRVRDGEAPEIDGYSIDGLSDLRGVAFRAKDDVDWRNVDGKNPPAYQA